MFVLNVTSEGINEEPFILQRFYSNLHNAICDFRKMVRNIPQFRELSDSSIGNLELGYSRNFDRFWFSLSEIPVTAPTYGKDEDEEDFSPLWFSKKELRKIEDSVSENIQKSGFKLEILSAEEMERRDREARVDESRMSEWQCPKCRHRVVNAQIPTIDGMEAWGCSRFCDTHNSSYFNGHACKLFENGDCFMVWP